MKTKQIIVTLACVLSISFLSTQASAQSVNRSAKEKQVRKTNTTTTQYQVDSKREYHKPKAKKIQPHKKSKTDNRKKVVFYGEQQQRGKKGHHSHGYKYKTPKPRKIAHRISYPNHRVLLNGTTFYVLNKTAFVRSRRGHFVEVSLPRFTRLLPPNVNRVHRHGRVYFHKNGVYFLPVSNGFVISV